MLVPLLPDEIHEVYIKKGKRWQAISKAIQASDIVIAESKVETKNANYKIELFFKKLDIKIQNRIKVNENLAR